MENKYVGFALHTTEKIPNFTKGFKKSDFKVNGQECFDYKIIGWANHKLAICEHIHKFEVQVPLEKNTNPMDRKNLSLVQYLYELKNGNGKILAIGSENEDDKKEKNNDK